MSMTQERRAAVALLIGVLAPLLIMGMHPTGGDITRGGARLVTINQLRPILVRFSVPAAQIPDLRRRAGRVCIRSRRRRQRSGHQ